MSAVSFTEVLQKMNNPPTEEKQNFNIYKTDDDKRLVFGWANVAIRVDGEQIQDYQDDIIDIDNLEEIAYEYVLNFRASGEVHNPDLRNIGRLVESCVFTPEKMEAMGIPEGILPQGWWVGFYIDDDDAWEKIKSGKYKMFSIEGTGQRIPLEGGEDE